MTAITGPSTGHFTELSARARARTVLDEGTFRELLGPFERLESPHLPPQGIVPQSDDGVVVARGELDGEQAVACSVDGRFQGGGIGEVAGAKIAGALELASRDARDGRTVRPVLLLESGGIRLQEANLGLLGIAEIHAAIMGLRRHVPVVGVIAGMVGCFGGMSIAAALCSHLVVTRQARLGLNGPGVIEQEAGIDEFDSSDQRLVWDTIGGEQRYSADGADTLADNDTETVRGAVRDAFAAGVPARHRSGRVDRMRAQLRAIDPQAPLNPAKLRALVRQEGGR